ncbi:hypothetical protein HX744_02930 [Pseudonocardia sp. ICBG1122]|nr:hypothetical protein [Pseudonocardia pini]
MTGVAVADPRRWGVILRVAALTGGAYERMQHLDQASLTGWTDDAIAAIEAGDHDGLPDDVARVLSGTRPHAAPRTRTTCRRAGTSRTARRPYADTIGSGLTTGGHR